MTPGTASGTLSSMASNPDKVRENRLRRMAERQGYALRKSSRRDPRAIDYGMYMLVDPQNNTVVAGAEGTGRPNLSLDDIEAWLTDDERTA